MFQKIVCHSVVYCGFFLFWLYIYIFWSEVSYFGPIYVISNYIVRIPFSASVGSTTLKTVPLVVLCWVCLIRFDVFQVHESRKTRR